MAKLKVVVFDIDGTLFNTFEHIVQALEHVMKVNGAQPDRQKIIDVVGKTLIECYEVLLPESDAHVVAEQHHSIQQTDEMLQLIDVYDGLRETLDLLKAKGLHCAVFTNRSRKGLDTLFEHSKLDEYFDVIITPELVKRGKPDPEGLKIIARELHVSTDELAMVGDTIVDIETGKNAGAMLTIGVTHGFGSREQLTAAGADKLIDSLHELPAVLNM